MASAIYAVAGLGSAAGLSSASSAVASNALGFGAAAGAAKSTEAAPFSELMTDAVGEVNRLEGAAKSAVSGLMTGTGVDVHTAMIATQKASMAFELALSVRNKAVQAYQQVMGMQF